MTIKLGISVGIMLGLGLITTAWSQSSPAKDIGSGSGDVATGPVKAPVAWRKEQPKVLGML